MSAKETKGHMEVMLEMVIAELSILGGVHLAIGFYGSFDVVSLLSPSSRSSNLAQAEKEEI